MTFWNVSKRILSSFIKYLRAPKKNLSDYEKTELWLKWALESKLSKFMKIWCTYPLM